MGGAGYWLLSFCLDDAPELRIGCSGERGRWRGGWFLMWLFFILALTFIRWDKDAINAAGPFMEEGTVWLLAAGQLVLPITRYLLSFFCDLHVAKLADSTEAASLLPEVADGLTAHSCFTVSEWAAVSFSAGGIVKEVAVISIVGHSNAGMRLEWQRW